MLYIPSAPHTANQLHLAKQPVQCSLHMIADVQLSPMPVVRLLSYCVPRRRGEFDIQDAANRLHSAHSRAVHSVWAHHRLENTGHDGERAVIHGKHRPQLLLVNQE
jgi:hypothetical protein